jgi:hypothetical protein
VCSLFPDFVSPGYLPNSIVPLCYLQEEGENNGDTRVTYSISNWIQR